VTYTRLLAVAFYSINRIAYIVPDTGGTCQNS
jgi:hypothetical protein